MNHGSYTNYFFQEIYQLNMLHVSDREKQSYKNKARGEEVFIPDFSFLHSFTSSHPIMLAVNGLWVFLLPHPLMPQFLLPLTPPCLYFSEVVQ